MKLNFHEEENSMKLFIVEVTREETFINEILVDKGKFKAFRKISGNFIQQAEQIVLLLLKEKPDKIIVEDVGIGKGLIDALINIMSNYKLELLNNGTVLYNG
jgi:hypothetical protein